jgi:integrase
MPLVEHAQQETPLHPKLRFHQACETYLSRRKRYLRPRSLEAYQYHFRTLHGFFDPTKRLFSFHEGDFRAYQGWRSNCGAGPSLINHELGALAQVLDLADLWHPISRYYGRLPERNWAPPKVLTAEQEDRFFQFASRNKEWKTAYNCARLTSNSTISGCELRTLRLEHLRLQRDQPVIQIPDTVKNRHRVRGVPLNSIALIAARELVELAKGRGSSEPEHYLIAFRVKKGVYDPCRPAGPCFIRTAFRAIAKGCGLPWVTPTTFRHQAITKLLESGAPDETVRAIAGHVSEKAMKYYSHIRLEAKKQAVDRLQPTPLAAVKSRNKSGNKPHHPLLAEVRETARQLGIPPDAALELVLTYERGKSMPRNNA